METENVLKPVVLSTFVFRGDLVLVKKSAFKTKLNCENLFYRVVNDEKTTTNGIHSNDYVQWF